MATKLVVDENGVGHFEECSPEEARRIAKSESEARIRKLNAPLSDGAVVRWDMKSHTIDLAEPKRDDKRGYTLDDPYWIQEDRVSWDTVLHLAEKTWVTDEMLGRFIRIGIEANWKGFPRTPCFTARSRAE